eukprot:5488830-Prymnesium_polylepis.1
MSKKTADARRTGRLSTRPVLGSSRVLSSSSTRLASIRWEPARNSVAPLAVSTSTRGTTCTTPCVGAVAAARADDCGNRLPRSACHRCA